MGREKDRIRRYRAPFRLDPAGLAGFDAHDAGLLIDPAPVRVHHAGQRSQVGEGVKPRLVLVPHGRRHGEGQRHLANQRGGHAGLVGRLHLLFQAGDLVRVLRIEVGGDAGEVTGDRVLFDQRRDELQGRPGRVHHHAQVVAAELGAQVPVTQIRHLGDVGRSAARGARAHLVLLKHRHPLALAHQQPRRRKARDAGAHDRDVHPHVAIERRVAGHLDVRPD